MLEAMARSLTDDRAAASRDARIPWMPKSTPLDRVEDGLECYCCGAIMERLPFHMVYLLCRDCEESMKLTHDFYITDYQQHYLIM